VGTVAAADLAGLPLDVWRGYIHEGLWGFRTQGAAGFARDWLVAVVPGWLAVAVLLTGGSVLVRRLPRTWPAVGGLITAGLAAVVVGAGPVVLEPLQVRTAPLPEGPVRTAVEQVLERADARVDAILVADASRRSTRENAYVSGLAGTRRVVLYDTLVANRSPAEVGMVLAHEFGHDAHGDVGRSTLLAGAGAVLTAAVLGAVLRRRADRGLQDGPADPRGAAVAVAVVTLLGVASLPVQSWASRRAEAAADLAALRLTDDPTTFAELQRNITRANLGNPRPPAWAVVLWGTHPSPTERLGLAEHYAATRSADPPPAPERPAP
jgi:STE24 endopeptidase